MRLAASGAVRPFIACTTLVVAGALGANRAAAADSLWQAEVRAGYGIAVGGSGARMSTRATPLTLAAIASFAFNEEPPLWGYGGLIVETLDRNAAGVVFGVRVSPRDSLRLSVGGTWLVAPYTLFGVTASAGSCRRALPHADVCGDVQLTEYIAGSDLAEGHTVTQVQLVVGVVFDAL